MLIGEAHRVLFHLGVLDSLPADRDASTG